MKLLSSLSVLCCLAAILPAVHSQPGFPGLSFTPFSRRFRRTFGRRPIGGFPFARRRLIPPVARPFARGFRYDPFGRIEFPEPTFPRIRRLTTIPPFTMGPGGFRPFSAQGGLRPFSPASTLFRTPAFLRPTPIPLPAVSVDRFGFDGRTRAFPSVSTFGLESRPPLRSVTSRVAATGRDLTRDRARRTFSPSFNAAGLRTLPEIPSSGITSGRFAHRSTDAGAFSPASSRFSLSDSTGERFVFGDSAGILPPARPFPPQPPVPSPVPTVDGFGFDNSLPGSRLTRIATRRSIGGLPATDTFGPRGRRTMSGTSDAVPASSRSSAASISRAGPPRLGGSVAVGVPFRNGRPVLGQTDDGAIGMEVGMGGHGEFPIMGGVGAGEMFKDGGVSLGLENGIEGHEQVEAALRPSMAAQIARGPPTADDIRRHRDLVRSLNTGTQQTESGHEGRAGGGEFGISNTFGARAMTPANRFRQLFR